MTIDLIKNTGIQFVSIPLNITEDKLRVISSTFYEQCVKRENEQDHYNLKTPYYWTEKDMFISTDPSLINEDAYDDYGELMPEYINPKMVKEIPEDETYKLYATDALALFSGRWVPLPFFKITANKMNKYLAGPQNWCRGQVREIEIDQDGNTHVLTLAFDTKTRNISSEYDDYLSPRDSDANDNGNELFRCVESAKDAKAYFASDMLLDWVYDIYSEAKGRKKKKGKLEYLAQYHVFLKLLNALDAFPEICLYSGNDRIDVGLTIDIGNSRTCGLVIEKNRPYDDQPFDLRDARKLKIRNLSAPHEYCDNPFEMQLAFSEELFGSAVDDFFSWPSLVRVGPEAVHLTSLFESEDSQATMSSPKRYLWDKKEVKIPWIKVPKDQYVGVHSNVRIHKGALYGIAHHLTNKGELNNSEEYSSATESRYSRSSLMTFALYEIILQSISQINSHEFRKDLGNSRFRRVLKDIVLTCPTAMTVLEQHQLRKAAKDAVVLLSKTVGDDLSVDLIEVHPALPSLDPDELTPDPWKYDEATCSQLSFLYGEIVHKYKSQQNLFFSSRGKLRQNSLGQKMHSLNIASIDIGGGTTDLMICNYVYDQDATIPIITPQPLFWEGFNVAGDDIVKRLIELILIPGISEYIESNGGRNANMALNMLFGSDFGGQTATQKIYRRQLANQIAAVFAFEVMRYVSQNSVDSVSILLDDIFERQPRPVQSLIDYANDLIRKNTGMDNFDLCSVPVLFNPLQINYGISDVIKPILDQLSYLISQFDCDIILLSGRPSKLPIISQILSGSLRFGPDKIIKLGDYKYGNWYPFANAEGYVDDPKSSVCVGALIAYLNSFGNLPKLQFDMEFLNKVESTAKYIGVIDPHRENILDPQILISPSQKEGTFRFDGAPVRIGMRQLDSEDWTASALYVFDFKDDERKEKFLRQNFKYPINARVMRKGEKGEFLDDKEIQLTDKDGQEVEYSRYFNFSFQTVSSGKTYWKDNGSFIVKIEGR
jgi:hypothetical protein